MLVEKGKEGKLEKGGLCCHYSQQNIHTYGFIVKDSLYYMRELRYTMAVIKRGVCKYIKKKWVINRDSGI